MSRLIVLSLSVLLVSSAAVAQTPPQNAPTPPPAARKAHPTFMSTLAEIAADPVTKAILEKHLPNITTNDGWEFIKSYTLTGLAGLSQGTFPQEKLNAIEADFKALSAT